ncbi:unnamed protein product [Linum tenue]
MRHW